MKIETFILILGDTTVFKPNTFKDAIEYLSTDLDKSEKEVLKFIEAIGIRESSGKDREVNTLGYRGLFQFGDEALEDVGLGHITKKKFEEDSNIFPIMEQIVAMANYMKKNRSYTESVKNHIGKTYNGIKITEAGILAASHLIGAGPVKEYLRSGGKKVEKDAYDTSLEEYLEKFANFDLSALDKFIAKIS